ncbi:hypothetical protein CANDROIZ_390005 [Candidatus Roizmanbacteria bacterium]|nr:hypothetical protein CANDROIZ_390005 [Candidatus Roizmanbacteria bacterium]
MKTYWQKIRGIVGPALAGEFDQVGQKKPEKGLKNLLSKIQVKILSFLTLDAIPGSKHFGLIKKNSRGNILESIITSKR